jgi:hypothetical protein
MRESNAISKDEFEISTNGYYRMEITLKASTRGPSPKYLYKEYESKTVVVTLDEKKKEGADDLENDCYLDITSFKPSINNKIGFTADKPEAVTVDFKLNCTSFDSKEFDVKPLSVSAYIDVPALNKIQKDIFQCETKTFDGQEIYKEGTPYTVTCSKEKVTEALTKESDQDTRNRFLMVDMYYLTNEKTGTNYGDEYKARFISTKDKISMPKPTDGGGDDTTPGDSKPASSDKKMEIDATVTPGKGRTFDNCKGGDVKII